ncbi:MAG: nucleotidyltransferase family protein [Actinomycetales bacterium]|nr:MAG: nucleotidyltransferase family protein [Actinomycetales bacterium]
MHAGIILAAGSGSRMGGPKATIEIAGERFVDRAVRLFHDAGFKDVYVVLGSWQGDVPGAKILINPDWQTGMGSSLRVGLEAILKNPEYSSAIVSLVDLPGMTAAAISEIAGTPSEIVMGTFNGKPGHPVKFARKYWKEIMESATGDFGARNFLKGRDDVSFIPLDYLANGKDVDTPEDLAGLTGGL